MLESIFFVLFWENSIAINCFLEDLGAPEKGLFEVLVVLKRTYAG